MKRSDKFYLSLVVLCLVLSSMMIVSFSLSAGAASEGRLKLINSWGENWGTFNDGSVYITYQAAINNSFPIFIADPRDDYQPQAIAVFKLEGNNRGQWTIKVQSGTSSKTFYPQDVRSKGGNVPFDSNEKLVLDITELMPFNNEDISLIVKNGSYSSGRINHFSVEIYNNYDSNPVNTYTSNQVPINVRPSSTKSVSVTNVSAKKSPTLKSKPINLKDVSRKLTDEDIDNFTKNNERNLSATKGNQIINGHGTGYKPLTPEEWKEAKKKDRIRVIDSNKVLQLFSESSQNNQVDHSKSKYFPPVGNQGEEGSCAAWAMTYYTNGFFEARDRNWDLSTFDANKTLSPAFTYSLVNGGQDRGSSVPDIVNVNANLGVSSWAKMPYDGYDGDVSSWGSEEAFRSAPQFRSKVPQTYYIDVKDNQDIEAIKRLLANGYVLVTAVDGNQYPNSGVWNAANYNASNRDLNHANTVVGFEDKGSSNQKPGSAEVTIDQNNNSSSYKILVTVPANNSAQEMRLYENNQVVKVVNLNPNSSEKQVIEYSVSNKLPGSYEYYAELSNDYGQSKSSVITALVKNENDSDIPVWNPYATYWGGDRVTYNKAIWKAKWWNYGMEPGTNRRGPWQKIKAINQNNQK
ncbi:C1 family peptidase [Sporohalobacter salinus]|uniref:C1 family peptidase n=1 Tax=Sporohalobacter salinus TaxID=1494606 RepID=UPI00195F6039|nr:C1 family peptidase [Sporohalobacter salinus]MBM7622707.1 hypothetical protein [Sporohalobacter salinus]